MLEGKADLAYVLLAERWVGHLSQVLPFLVIWSGQNVVVRSSLQDIQMLHVHARITASCFASKESTALQNV